MDLEDMILVSVDDHLIEPEDMFAKHIAPRFRDRAPVVKRGSGGAHHWQIEGQKAPGLGLNAVAGRPKEEYGFEPPPPHPPPPRPPPPTPPPPPPTPHTPLPPHPPRALPPPAPPP